MDAQRWPYIKDLFFQLLELNPVDHDRFFEELAMKDLAAANEVKSLLKSHREADAQSSLKAIPSKVLQSALSEAPRFTPGQMAAQFRIIKEIGRGALATVYVAHDTALDRLVAVKIGSVKNEKEAKLLATLDHPHIVRVYSTFNEKNYSLLCMQYLDGKNLADHLVALEKATEKKVVSILEQIVFIAEALDHAHQKGLLHLDIKPANLLYNAREELHLSDFNVSLSKTELELGQLKGFGGTEKYMAPEQLAVMRCAEIDQPEAAKKVGPHSDVYSLTKVIEEIAEFLPTSEGRFSNLKEEVFSLRASRLATASQLASTLKGILNRYALESHLPPMPQVLKTLKQHRVFAIIAAMLLPQIFGSLVNILYNNSQIISELTPEAKNFFFRIVVFYNFLTYPLCAGYFVWMLRKTLRSPDSALLLPRHSWITTSLGWLPGALIFPVALSLGTGLSPGLFFHFIFSFLISWLVAGVYSTLFSSYSAYHFIYLPHWKGHSDDGPAKRSFKNHLQALPLLAGVVPLFGALVAVLGNPTLQSDEVAYRGLLAALLIVGIIALPLTQKVCRNLETALEQQT